MFVVALSDQPYAGVFGPSSTAPYLSHTLERQGELLVRYYAVAHEELANGAALVSGQGPTADTAANCPTYTDVVPATPAAEEQVIGNGCVYPPATQTLAGQLSEKHLTWRAYVEGMDEAAGQAPACGHPALGQTDPTAPQAPAAAVTPAGAAAPSEQAYATSRNPFVYFHSVIDTPACAADDVGLNRLSPDLASARQHPELLLHRPGPLPRREPDALRSRTGRPGCRRRTASSRRWSRRSSARRPTSRTGCS